MKIKLKSISAVITFKKRILKQNYFKNLFSNNSPYETWNNINSVLNVKKKSKPKIKGIIDVNDVYTENKSNVAENFNKYYTSIGKEMSDRIVTNVHDDVSDLNSLHRSVNSIFFNRQRKKKFEFDCKVKQS